MRTASTATGTLMDFEENRAFFKQFGKRLAALRKSRGVTQVELGEATGYSQQQVQAFEKGRRRMPLSVLPRVIALLGVSYEELLGVEKPTTSAKRGPPSKLEKQARRAAKLPRPKQRLISEVLETLIQQAS